MANKEQLDILKQGVEVWNQWRQNHPGILPDLQEADLRYANLSSVDLSEADLIEALLRNTVLSEADLRNANLIEANLIEADLNSANLLGADLSEALLRNTDLRNANLRYANLSRADVSRADLSDATLSSANLSGANLYDANLSSVDLYDADLSGATLSGATLVSVDLIQANLGGANFSNAYVGWTRFGDVDLSVVKSLETVKHNGPSTIGIDTIIRSQGKIPEIFLKGAGVDDTFITYIRSLVGKPIEYYSCFISYSSKDEAFAKRLYADLQSNNVRCWFAPEDMKIGDRIRPRIDESIRKYDRLLLVLSEYSVASKWVEFEVEAAMDKEQEGKPPVLFPVRLDNTVLDSTTAWSAHIKRTRNIGDFTRWKDHDDYEKAFSRLLRDLKSEAMAS